MPEFPLAKFRILYPQFEGKTDEEILAFADQALCFVNMYGCECSEQAWMLMVAHLLTLNAAAAGGGNGLQLSGATIDGVTVSFAAPTSSSSWSYWLNGSPFGQMFAALNARCNSAMSGSYAGQFPERAAFRNVGGRFALGGRIR